MKKVTLNFIILFMGITSLSFAQDNKAKALLDVVSTTMSNYKNMEISFSSSLSNEDAGIKEGDELPNKGIITLAGEKYSLNYLGNDFIFNGKTMYIINHDELEITSNDGDFEEDDGFIYPSRLLTFYKEGYNFEMGKATTIKGKRIQFVILTPIDSNSEIVKVELAIETKTKHIYKLIQTGANSSKTSFTITSFKSNLTLAKGIFSLDKQAYLKKEYTID